MHKFDLFEKFGNEAKDTDLKSKLNKLHSTFNKQNLKKQSPL